MVWSSQKSFPHFRQLTLPLVEFSLLPHIGSEQIPFAPGFCQCALVTTSSGSTLGGSEGFVGARELTLGSGTGGGASFDSNTSRPFSFWLSTARGWNFLALIIWVLNQSLTSSCLTSSRFLWVSSRCLRRVSDCYNQNSSRVHLFNCSNVT